MLAFTILFKILSANCIFDLCVIFSAPGTISRRPNGQPSSRRLMLDNFDANTAITKTDTTSAGNGAGQKVDLESGGEALSSAKPVQKTVKEHVINLICDGMYLYRLLVRDNS